MTSGPVRTSQMADGIDDAMEALAVGVQDLLSWKAHVAAVLALPVSVVGRFGVVVSKVLRSHDRLQRLIGTSNTVLRLFAVNLVKDKELCELEQRLEQRSSERDMLKMRALESERKLRNALVQIQDSHGQHNLFRWSRLVAKVNLLASKAKSSAKVRCKHDVSHVLQISDGVAWPNQCALGPMRFTPRCLVVQGADCPWPPALSCVCPVCPCKCNADESAEGSHGDTEASHQRRAWPADGRGFSPFWQGGLGGNGCTCVQRH